MSEQKHTPGPWTVKQDRWFYKPGQLPWRVESNTVESGEQAGVGRAQTIGYAYRRHDALVFAAAPEMLAVLREIVAFDVPLRAGLLEQARAAISKVKGGA
jgi:hypothetical protein